MTEDTGEGGENTNGPSGGGDRKISNEVVWTLKQISVLLHFWTMPLRRMIDSSQAETVSARAFALVLIVALTFAIRGELSGAKFSYFTALAASLATILSIALNFIAKRIDVSLGEPLLVSAYTSSILVMVAFLALRAWSPDWSWYQDWLVDNVGPTYAAIAFGVVIVYALLFLKAAFWDRNEIHLRSALLGFGVTICSGGIVSLIYYMSNDTFDGLINIICRACSGRT